MLEINQACALNGECFSGDSTGFPVTIDGSAGKSYRLTGDLDLTAVPDTTAIDIDAPYITLDLNGFEIAGPIVCSGSGQTLNCGAVGNGDGVSLSANADFVTIENGTIRNMSRHGIGASGNQLTVRKVRAVHNARDGLNGGLESLAANCIAYENGNDGFQFGSGSVIEGSAAFGNGTDGIRIEASNGVIDNSTARNNGESGFVMGHSSRFGRNSSTGNALADECGGGVCTERRRYYLTQTTHQGNEVLGACASGFVFASLWEIFDTAGLQYDTWLGYSAEDQGGGPTSVPTGWIRTGSADLGSGANAGTGGSVNCNLWSSSDSGTRGSWVRPWIEWENDHSETLNEVFGRWGVGTALCDTVRRVWCIEN